MKLNELYDVDSMCYADYDFEKCEKKEILSKMLKNLTPKQVKRFSSKGTSWDLWGEFDNYFLLNINGAALETSTCVSNFIEDLLHFLLQLAYTDDKILICPFHYEGFTTAFLTVPVENDNMRVAVFDSNTVWKYSLDIKFEADIVIKKDTLLKQIYNILDKVKKDTIEKSNKPNTYVNKINYILSELDKYFEDSKKYKEEFEPKRHIRVIDVAYKTLENEWKFEVFLEDDRKANPLYWKKIKNEGKILDYDIIEQYSEDLFYWTENYISLRKVSKDEIKQDLEPDLQDRIERNWVYSKDTKKWYSEDEVMPLPKKENSGGSIHTRLKYEIEIEVSSYEQSEDVPLESYISRSYDIDGNLIEDKHHLGYLKCYLKIKSEGSVVCKIEFDYRNNEEIRNGLKKAKVGEYTRFDLGGNKQDKMHLWQQFYENTETDDAKYLEVICYSSPNDDFECNELYRLTVDKNGFIDCFNNALDEIENKINVTKHVLEVGKKLKIKDKFSIEKKRDYCLNKFEYVENFVGDYACVYKDSVNGAGIINKNFEWVIKPESVTITGKTHSKWGKEILGFVTRYKWLHNINGKLFIATKDDNKKFVMDINGDIQIPHVSDETYYTTLNNELYFLAVEYDKTYITDSKGKDILVLDFPIGETSWLSDDIIIVSKDGKYGIIDWCGNVIIDFIFSEIKPDEDDKLDYIPVRYIDMWGYVDKKGKIFNLKIKDKNQNQ